jgi:hypothetical protein
MADLCLTSPYRRPPTSHETTQPPQRTSLKRAGDPVPFDLRNNITGNVRRPTAEEFDAIRAVFPTCTGYKICSPILILQCPIPPETTPLTVGGLPTVFVPDMRQYDSLGGLLGNPQLRLDGSNFKIADNEYPTFTQMEAIFQVFTSRFPNIVRIAWRYTNLVVTLSSSTAFTSHQYPGRVGDIPVAYTWPGRFKPQSRQGLILPSQTTGGDNSNYRELGLCPGVKVVGRARATSSGVVVANNHARRLTLAEQGFQDTDNVYHPDLEDDLNIADIGLRFPLIDVALATLAPSISYTNKVYFTANPPKKLVPTEFVEEYVGTHTWFEAEGFTTGRVHMLYMGPAVGYPEVSNYVYNSCVLRTYGLEYFGPEVGEVKEGLCGAPVVHEFTDDDNLNGIVLGFIWSRSDRDLIVAAVDELLDAGWQISDE